MYKHVVLKNLRLIEGFGTLVESIKLLPNMYQHVPLVMMIILKGFGTLDASIKSIASHRLSSNRHIERLGDAGAASNVLRQETRSLMALEVEGYKATIRIHARHPPTARR